MNLMSFLTKIGNSEKLNQSDKNGRFGFGVQSFRSIGEDLEI